MLLTTISGLDDQDLADRMRRTARMLCCSPVLIEQAVDEAVTSRKFGATESAAIGAGINLIHQFTQGRVTAHPPGHNTPSCELAGRVPFSWVESWWFIGGGLAVVVALAWLLSRSL